MLERVEARLEERFGPEVVPLPKRTAGYRWMHELDRRQPTFRLSTKRNREIAARPAGVYGKLRPTRPGEYVLMDATRLDVFAFDPVTLKWVQAELTVAMDWYTRCITGIRVTPVSTKAVDAAAVLFQTYRPRPVPETWPKEAAWPENLGIPRRPFGARSITALNAKLDESVPRDIGAPRHPSGSGRRLARLAPPPSLPDPHGLAHAPGHRRIPRIHTRPTRHAVRPAGRGRRG